MIVTSGPATDVSLDNDLDKRQEHNTCLTVEEMRMTRKKKSE